MAGEGRYAAASAPELFGGRRERRIVVIEKLGDAFAHLRAFCEQADAAQAAELVGLLPAFDELRKRFEERTSPLRHCSCDAPLLGSKMHRNGCPAGGNNARPEK